MMKIQGWGQDGGYTVSTPGNPAVESTTKVQQSFPGCTVTVYDAGTVDVATIYSDSAGTPKANPFTADVDDGKWFFYATDGASYDIQFSGGGIPVPFTLGDVWTPIGDVGIASGGVDYTDAITEPITDFVARKGGERVSVKDWGAKGDTVYVTDAVMTSGSPTLTSATAGFAAGDVGKSVVVYGAGSGGDRESVLREFKASQTSTNVMTAVAASVMDAQSGTSVKYAFNCATFSVDWEVWGDNASDFSSEVKVDGPSTQEALDVSDSYVDGGVVYRYYRVKIKSSGAGDHGLGYVTGIVLGRVLATTISAFGSSTSVTLTANAGAMISAASCHFGTDDTAAIQLALDSLRDQYASQGGRGGQPLFFPRGIYLVSAQIAHHKNITCEGGSGSGTWILANGGTFPTSTVLWKIGDYAGTANAFFTQLRNIRIDCANVPGSVGIYSDAAQENSGLDRVTVIKWMAKGIHFYHWNAQHGQMNDLWVYPSSAVFMDDTAIGIYLENTVSPIPIKRATITAQGGLICGYGSCIKVTGLGNARLEVIHIEKCGRGIECAAGSQASIESVNGHETVYILIQLDTDNPVEITHCNNTGKYNLLDNTIGGGIYFDDNFLGNYHVTKWPTRFKGFNSTDEDIVQFTPGNKYGGLPTVAIRRHGGLEINTRNTNLWPNIMVFNPINFGSPWQGGLLSVNSESVGFPDWEQTSDRYVFTNSGNTITAVGHPYSDDDIVQGFNVGGALPTGMSTGPAQSYYVISQSGDTFELSLTLGGAAITLSDTGTGTHYISHYVGAGFYRFGASRFEVMHGDAENALGGSPGTVLFRVDKDTGVTAFRQWFAATPGTEMLFGNNYDANQARWSHGSATHNELKLELTDDTWSTEFNGLFFDITTRKLYSGCAIFPSGQTVAGVYAYAGSPENNVTASKGSICMDSANGDVYKKNTGTGNTGWVAL